MTLLLPQSAKGTGDNLIFRFINIEQLGSRMEEAPSSAFAECYILLLVTKGSCLFFIDKQLYTLERDRGLLISPGMLFEYERNGSELPEGYYIQFEALSEHARNEENRIFQLSADVFNCGVDLPKPYFPELHRLAVLLWDSHTSAKELRRHSDRISFYKLVYLLMDINEPGQEQETDARYAILRTIQEMERRYAEPLTRDELAAIACMSPWHYSHVFKTITGLSPHSYLSKIRILQSKALLRNGMKISEAARRVGYGDDSHFRRKFREEVGMPPSIFAASKHERIATVSYHYAAHLMALDIIPYAAPVDRQREYHRSRYHDLISVHLLRRKIMPADFWRHNMQSLAEAKPEMILCDDIIPPEIDEQLRKIAPTFVVPWMGKPWRDQFRQIASIVGQQKAAERWIDHYENKANEAKTIIQRSIGNETVTLLHMMLGKLIIYGRRNGGAVLYDDLGLRPPFDTVDIPVFRTLSALDVSLLHDTAHLLLVVDKDEESQQAWEQLQQDTEWTTIRAVQNGQVYLIEETPWLEYSPYAHELVIEQAQQLLGTK
ncbi:ABC transporter substrate-binding protein [Paenibacillus gorillae]|uniref:ABC transporter substrate-binding protein n=1 Tax=Paenibacillus gorillae TaxID=1243662 RepID=UPI0005A88E3B|nr:helix-turn-helix domain-containing protein [Paenibacillus gorillae]